MSSAAGKLNFEAPAPADDPIWRAFLRAPISPPETEEQRQMSAAALRGPFPSSAAIAARCPPGT